MTSGNHKRGRGDSNEKGRLSPIARELNPEHHPVGDTQRFPRSIAGDSFAAGDPVKQYSPDRRCNVCDEKLSRYNPGPGCSRHPSTKMVVRETPKVTRIDSRKTRKSVTKKVAKRTKK